METKREPKVGDRVRIPASWWNVTGRLGERIGEYNRDATCTVAKDGWWEFQHDKGGQSQCSHVSVADVTFPTAPVPEVTKKGEGRDWSKWLPPHKLPDTGRKKLREGQVWAFRDGEDARVYRIGKPLSATMAEFEHLAATAMRGIGQIYDASIVATRSVLVQDVGQSEPTPPEFLYATPPTEAPGVEARCGKALANYPGHICEGVAGHSAPTCKPPLGVAPTKPAPKPRTKATYEDLLRALEASEGVTHPTCKQCRQVVSTVNQDRKCFECYAKDDYATLCRTAAAQYKFKPYEPEPEAWRPSCDPDFWIPGPTEFGS